MDTEFVVETRDASVVEPGTRAVVAAIGASLAFVLATRLPVARSAAWESDEVGYLAMIQEDYFPKFHTLFLAAAHAIGKLIDDPYRGFILLDCLVSAGALAACWWWLRSLVGPRTAAATALALGCGPVFWAYGAMAGNYTMIPLVGAMLLGIARRGRGAPRAWHPWGASAILAVGAGYRQDIGTFWLPVYAVILWQHRWLRSIGSLGVFAGLNLAWFLPMLHEAGGWSAYRAESGKFAYSAGYLNSSLKLGWIDAPLRYGVKEAMALAWTLGPGLLIVPLGIWRLAQAGPGRWLLGLLALSLAPALASHLLIHFGVPGYSFHLVPALLGLMAMGIGGTDAAGGRRGLALAALLAAVFLLYPTDFRRPGVRGDFDLAFARLTRVGLTQPIPFRDPKLWRTTNSQEKRGDSGRRTDTPRRSIGQLWGN